MTRLEEEWADLLAAEVHGGTKREMIGDLLARGLLDARACERIAIRRRVEAFERAGLLRGAAMERTAEHHCCSYEKVRAVVYMKNKF